MLTLHIFWANPECLAHFVGRSRMFYSVSDIFVLSSWYKCIVKRERLTNIGITSAQVSPTNCCLHIIRAKPAHCVGKSRMFYSVTSPISESLLQALAQVPPANCCLLCRKTSAGRLRNIWGHNWKIFGKHLGNTNGKTSRKRSWKKTWENILENIWISDKYVKKHSVNFLWQLQLIHRNTPGNATCAPKVFKYCHHDEKLLFHDVFAFSSLPANVWKLMSTLDWCYSSSWKCILRSLNLSWSFFKKGLYWLQKQFYVNLLLGIETNFVGVYQLGGWLMLQVVSF